MRPYYGVARASKRWGSGGGMPRRVVIVQSHVVSLVGMSDESDENFATSSACRLLEARFGRHNVCARERGGRHTLRRPLGRAGCLPAPASIASSHRDGANASPSAGTRTRGTGTPPAGQVVAMPRPSCSAARGVRAPVPAQVVVVMAFMVFQMLMLLPGGAVVWGMCAPEQSVKGQCEVIAYNTAGLPYRLITIHLYKIKSSIFHRFSKMSKNA